MATRTFKLLHIVGTRPNFMKVAPVMAAVRRWNEAPASEHAVADAVFGQVLVHTGQHYDQRMSHVFFDELGLPQPDYHLGIGSGSHAEQTARVMLAIEPVLVAEAPDLVVVVGDVNSTLAAALVARKLGIPIAHVEAGLRSQDWDMPEETNRLLTDQLSDILFTTCRDADKNLLREGIPGRRIRFVGNSMIDSLEAQGKKIDASTIVGDLGLMLGGYAVITLHRPSNVDEPEGLRRLALTLGRVAHRIPLVFPVHARTRARLGEFGLVDRLECQSSLILIEPLGHADFVALMRAARLVLTDSGGIQEETTVLGVPCLTLRNNTERPVTISEGTNRLVNPDDSAAIQAAVGEVLSAPVVREQHRPEGWDGRASDRIVVEMAHWLAENCAESFGPVNDG
jgi:UDP-N-acetylglucosamine 2-epimerase (non-hydrolysing)